MHMTERKGHAADAHQWNQSPTGHPRASLSRSLRSGATSYNSTDDDSRLTANASIPGARAGMGCVLPCATAVVRERWGGSGPPDGPPACSKPCTPPPALFSRRFSRSMAWLGCDVTNKMADLALLKMWLFAISTCPPAELIETPEPELEWIRLCSRVSAALFHSETPSPSAPKISLRRSVALPPFATTLAPRHALAMVLSVASSAPRYTLIPGPMVLLMMLCRSVTRAAAPTHTP